MSIYITLSQKYNIKYNKNEKIKNEKIKNGKNEKNEKNRNIYK